MASSGPYARPWNHFLTKEISLQTLSQEMSGEGLWTEYGTIGECCATRWEWSVHPP